MSIGVGVGTNLSYVSAHIIISMTSKSQTEEKDILTSMKPENNDLGLFSKKLYYYTEAIKKD